MLKTLEQKLQEANNASEAIEVMLDHFYGDRVPMTQLFLSKLKNEFEKIENGDYSLWIQDSESEIKSKEGSIRIIDTDSDESKIESGYSLIIGSGAGENALFRDYFNNNYNKDSRGVNTIIGATSGKDSEGLYFSTLFGSGAGAETKAMQNMPSGLGSEQGILTAIGSSAARGIENLNYSSVFGAGGGQHSKTMIRCVLVGQNSAAQDPGNTKEVELYKTTILGSFNAYRTNNLEHIISIGHESILGNAERKDSIIVGDYAGINRAIYDSIFIGHYRKRGSGHNFGNPETSNVISIGHFVKPEQEFTINFPLSYDMGIGTFTPDAKIVVKANSGQDSIAKFKDENDEVILDVKNNGNISIKVPDNYSDDTAAEAGGVPIGGIYRTNSTLKVRVS